MKINASTILRWGLEIPSHRVTCPRAMSLFGATVTTSFDSFVERPTALKAGVRIERIDRNSTRRRITLTDTISSTRTARLAAFTHISGACPEPAVGAASGWIYEAGFLFRRPCHPPSAQIPHVFVTSFCAGSYESTIIGRLGSLWACCTVVGPSHAVRNVRSREASKRRDQSQMRGFRCAETGSIPTESLPRRRCRSIRRADSH